MGTPVRLLCLACLAVAGSLACASPCREADSRSERRELEMDSVRCEDRARKLAGNIDVGDYRSCMRVRGWCAPPDDR